MGAGYGTGWGATAPGRSAHGSSSAPGHGVAGAGRMGSAPGSGGTSGAGGDVGSAGAGGATGCGAGGVGSGASGGCAGVPAGFGRSLGVVGGGNGGYQPRSTGAAAPGPQLRSNRCRR